MKSIPLISFFLIFLFFDSKIQKTIYPKFPVWIYLYNVEDNKEKKVIKKNIKEIDNTERILFDIGQQLTAIKEKNSGSKTYYQIILPNKKNYWIDASFVTEKYITINSEDVACYKQPSMNSLNNNFKLQPGDFGYFIKEKNGFINVEFNLYLPRGIDNSIVLVGNVWIKEGYTDDINTAKEAYWLSAAYNQIYIKNPNKEIAKKYLINALEENRPEKTKIALIAQKVLKELK